MYKCRFIFVAVLLMSVSAMADYVIVPVPNFSFEQPGTAKQSCWDGERGFTDVPNWFSDYEAFDSGVESDWPGCTEGSWSGYLMGKDWKETSPGVWTQVKDPSVWQILPYRIKTGDQFALAVDSRDNWTEDAGLPATLQMTLFYVADGGARTVLATVTQPLTTTWTTFYLDAGDTTAAVGRLLGIELYNPSEARSWIGIDNVRFVPEPATIALLGLGGLALIRRKR